MKGRVVDRRILGIEERKSIHTKGREVEKWK